MHESSVETTVVLPILSYKDVIDSVASVDSIIDSKGYESIKKVKWENILFTLVFCRAQSVVDETHHLLSSSKFSPQKPPHNKRIDKKN